MTTAETEARDWYKKVSRPPTAMMDLLVSLVFNSQAWLDLLLILLLQDLIVRQKNN